MKNCRFEQIDKMFVSSFKSKGVFMAVRIERMTLHSVFYLFFYFSTDLVRIIVKSEIFGEVVKILPSQLHRVNMSLSIFFQQDLLAVFVIKVGPHYAMLYNVVRRQWDWRLCSVQMEKKLLNIQNMRFTFPISVGFFYWFFLTFL